MSIERRDGLLDSFLDAFKAGNIFLRILQFVFFGIVTATPYLVFNLNRVPDAVQASGATGGFIILAYFKALMGAVWIGIGIGLSTVFSTLIEFFKGNFGLGNILFSLIVIGFGTWMLYQPIRLIFNIADMKKGRDHSVALIFLISLAVTVVVASPLAYVIADGQTITSGIGDDEVKEQSAQTTYNETTNETIIIDEQKDDSLTNSLNMLTGG